MMTVLHVIFGTFVLAVAPGGCVRTQRRTLAPPLEWSKAFMLAMGVVLFTAGFMWQPKGHIFLLALSLVSAYFVFHGFRILARRRRRRRRREDDLDNGVDLLAAVVAGTWLFWIAAAHVDKLMHSLAPIMAGLGAVAIAFALNDVRGIIGPRSRVGAYISAVTAFVVINAHGVPMLLRWFVPISMGTRS
jgi:hypothetical protein